LPVYELLNRFRDRLTDGMRINRLLEADPSVPMHVDECFRRPALPDPDRSRERRAEPRFDSQGPCDVAVITPGSAFSVRGEVADLSRSGAGLLLPCVLAPGREVTVRTGRLILFGTVLHSRAEGNGLFRTGIRLRDVFELENPPAGL
jgi:hypothetical protein